MVVVPEELSPLYPLNCLPVVKFKVLWTMFDAVDLESILEILKTLCSRQIIYIKWLADPRQFQKTSAV